MWVPWEQHADPADFLPFSIYGGSPNVSMVVQELMKQELGWIHFSFNREELRQIIYNREIEEEETWMEMLRMAQADNKAVMAVIQGMSHGS